MACLVRAYATLRLFASDDVFFSSHTHAHCPASHEVMLCMVVQGSKEQKELEDMRNLFNQYIVSVKDICADDRFVSLPKKHISRGVCNCDSQRREELSVRNLNCPRRSFCVLVSLGRVLHSTIRHMRFLRL
jgi:hypothetical protein